MCGSQAPTSFTRRTLFSLVILKVNGNKLGKKRGSKGEVAEASRGSAHYDPHGAEARPNAKESARRCAPLLPLPDGRNRQVWENERERERESADKHRKAAPPTRTVKRQKLQLVQFGAPTRVHCGYALITRDVMNLLN